MTYIINVLHKYKLSDKVIAFCGQNCHTNFGGAATRGGNNIFAKLKTTNLKLKIQVIGCVAHMLHNALQTSTDILSIDVEAIVNKIFQYFHTCMVWLEELKEFCDFINWKCKNQVALTLTANNNELFPCFPN
jgi:hypothetical protein